MKKLFLNIYTALIGGNKELKARKIPKKMDAKLTEFVIKWFEEKTQAGGIGLGNSLEGFSGMQAVCITNAFAQSAKKRDVPNAQKIEKFKILLQNLLISEWNKCYEVVFRVDYGPDYCLGNLYKEADLRCPIPNKTNIIINFREGTMRVCGYQQEGSGQIYPAAA